MQRLNQKITLITGAARGIGEAIARTFIEEGATVIVTDIDHDLGKTVANSLGERAIYLPLDVRDESAWQAVMAEILQRYGVMHVLVNNAGITGFEHGFVAHDPEHASLQDWRSVLATNLDGVFLGCKYAIQSMRKAADLVAMRGSIINISSRSGLVGIPAATAYAASKAAVRNHTKSVALYCAEQGLPIRCNSIHPAAILTPMWEPMLGQGDDRDSRMRDFVRECPMQRFGLPQEVAAVALLLASDEAAYMNGSELMIDGGMLAGSVARPTPKG